MTNFLFPLVATSAIVDSFQPCAFSVLLLTIAFLFNAGKTRSRILWAGLLYIAGIFLIYLGVGLGVLRTLNFFNIPHFLARAGAVIMIFWGLTEIIGHYFPSFPIKLRIPASAHDRIGKIMVRGTMAASLFLGAAVGIFEFPCAGGPYLTVLTLLHDHATFWKGFSYLLVYNFFFVLPLIVILLVASNRKLLAKAQAWRKSEAGKMRIFGGLAMIALGVIIFML